ncbi:MAG TPA: proline--tRNA ligase [Methanothermobacter sp.]|nr:prolyl-tRNA synthetase [Methanothermobacter sp. MT-2]HHW05048.1 proline--tRNA ligase [Methanothermobacter sp.]HOK72554.1 proline--tRNA ligase [Methanothermobacter sp.]HOL69383.1 proline--tRNA ligase [Methanothermobacter sp.]HPQ04041.1 proline--tRNA ligase [Methanothermobacter sp.]
MIDFSEWFHNILEEAKIIDPRYPIKGMNVWLPYGFQLRKNTLKILRDIMDRDHEETLFPLLIPEDQLEKESIHVKGFEDEVYWITHGGLTRLNKKLALRPTSETAMYPMFSLWIRSHTDLPLRIYQIVNTFRYETKHTRPLIRVREITTFKEAHTVHETMEEAEKQVQEAIKLYKEFFNSLAIPYLITKRPPWDKFPGSDYTIAFDTLMPDGKTLQIATVHNLGQTFSKTFEIKFETPTGEHEHAYQTCYGLSDRVIASIIAVHGDELGLRLPPKVAPYQIIIVPVIFKEKIEEVIRACREVKKRLKDLGLRVKLDDRDIRAGRKYYEWEMKGAPLRIEIGPRDLKKGVVTIARRDTKEKIEIKLENLEEKIEEILEDTTKTLREEAWKKMQENIRTAKNLKEAKKIIEEKKGIISLPWCGDEECGKNMEEKIKVDILGITETKKKSSCINCGKEANYKAFLAKTY